MYHKVNDLAKAYNRTYDGVMKILKKEGVEILKGKQPNGKIVSIISSKSRRQLEMNHPYLTDGLMDEEKEIRIPDAHQDLKMSREAIWRYIKKLDIPVFKKKYGNRQPVQCILKVDMEKIRKAAPIILEENSNTIDYLFDEDEE
jgi:hypothetical protein